MQIVPGKLTRLLCGLMLLSARPFVYAQEVQIFFTSGGEFTLTSGGYRSIHQGGVPDAGALNLRRNDIIQTGQGCFVELHLEPGGTRIKIAENTALAYNGPGKETLSVSFVLIYGRMRVSTAGTRSHGGNAVFVKAGEVEAVFRTGDASLDYIVNSGIAHLTTGEPLLTVYNFNGNSELWPSSWLTNAARGSASGFVVHEYESLTMETANSLVYVERRPLYNEIIQYWNRNNFTDGAPPLTLRPTAAPPPAEALSDGGGTPPVIERIEYAYPQGPPVIIEYIYPDNPFDRRLFRVKNFLLSTGMLFTLGGVGMQIAGSYGVPSLDDNANKMLFNFGYVPMVIGLIFNGAALVILPKNLEKNAAD